MASNLTHVKFCEIQAPDCDGWDCNICKEIFDAIKSAEALKPSHNTGSSKLLWPNESKFIVLAVEFGLLPSVAKNLYNAVLAQLRAGA